MAAILTRAIGGLIAVVVIGWLVGLAFKAKAPTDRAVYAVMIAWALCTAAAGLAVYAATGAVLGEVAVDFFPGAILALYLLRHHYAKTQVS